MSIGSETAAWGAAIAASAALLKQTYDIIRNRRTEKSAVADALDRQPLIKEQLEIGNWGSALSHVNTVVVLQAGQLDRAYARITHLESREEALEAEVDGYKRVLDETRTQNAKLGRRVDLCEQSLRSLGIDPVTMRPLREGNQSE